MSAELSMFFNQSNELLAHAVDRCIANGNIVQISGVVKAINLHSKVGVFVFEVINLGLVPLKLTRLFGMTTNSRIDWDLSSPRSFSISENKLGIVLFRSSNCFEVADFDS